MVNKIEKISIELEKLHNKKRLSHLEYYINKCKETSKTLYKDLDKIKKINEDLRKEKHNKTLSPINLKHNKGLKYTYVKEFREKYRDFKKARKHAIIILREFLRAIGR